MLMNEAYRKILFILFKNDDFITASTLAGQIGISIKTLRKYIQIINTHIQREGAEIYSKVSAGYKIIAVDNSKFHQFRNNILGTANNVSFYANSQRMRVHFIIRYLLSNNRRIQIQELAEHLFYSESSILKDMKAVKNMLQLYGLQLDSGNGNNGIQIVGSEWKLRNLLNWELRIFQNNNLINSEKEDYFENLFLMKSDLYQKIHTEILSVFKEKHLFIAYENLQFIESWIVMSKTRFQYKSELSFRKEVISWAKSSSLYAVSTQIYENVFDGHSNNDENERVGLTILLERFNENSNLKSWHIPAVEIDCIHLFQSFNEVFPGLFDAKDNQSALDELARSIQEIVNQQVFSQRMDIYDENIDYVNQVKLNGLFILDLCLFLVRYLRLRYHIDLKNSSAFYLPFLSYLDQNSERTKFKYKVLWVLSMSDISSKALINSLEMKETGMSFDKTLIQYDQLNEVDQSSFDYAFTDINNSEILQKFQLPIIHLSFENFYFDPIFQIQGMNFKQYRIHKIFKEENFIKCENLSSFSHLCKIVYAMTERWNLPFTYYKDIVNEQKPEYEIKSNNVLILKSYQSYGIHDSHWGLIFLKKAFQFKENPCKLICVCHFGEHDFVPHVLFIHKLIAEIIHNIDFYSFHFHSLTYSDVLDKLGK